ncbi:MAG: hypothetical protein AB7P21_26690 [Lautropia sp.]
MRYLFALLLVLSHAGAVYASCRDHDVTVPSAVRPRGESVMIVVHATSSYDARASAKRGIDDAVRFAKGAKIPVVYLQDDTPDEFYFMQDCSPDYWVYSQGGEVSFEVAQSHLYIVGGHLELCLSATLHDVIGQWAKRPPRNFTVTYFMDAIYSNGKAIEASDPYYDDFGRFIGIVTHGRPGGEQWPKLTLLETMGIIRREEHELAYIRKILPRWDRSFPPAFRIEVQMNGSSRKVLRAAPGWNPPTVLFQFVDSALSFATASEIRGQ